MHNTQQRDEFWMQLALKQAQKAADCGEVPVGAVLVQHDQLIVATHNLPITQHNPCGHAEVLALQAAGQVLQNYRMPHCELFVTLEPCLMCAGAIFHARLARVVFAASDPKTGVAGSHSNVFSDTQLNHHTQVTGGVCADIASTLLRDFFRQRRQSQREM